MFKQHKRSTKWHKIRPFPLSSLFKELLSRPDRSIEWLCSEQDQDDGEMVDNGRVALHSFRMKESLYVCLYICFHQDCPVSLRVWNIFVWYDRHVWLFDFVWYWFRLLSYFSSFSLSIWKTSIIKASPFINVRLLAYESWQCLNFFCRFSPRSRVSGIIKSSFVRNFLFMSRSVVSQKLLQPGH